MTRFAKFVTTSTRAGNPTLNYLLNSVNPDLVKLYNRGFSSIINRDEIITYKHMINLDGDAIKEVAKVLQNEIDSNIDVKKAGCVSRIDLASSKVLQSLSYDVELKEKDRFGKILLSAEDDITIRYGDTGILPSESLKSLDMLKYEFKIPKKSFSVVNIRNHTPFLIETKDVEKSFAIAASIFVEVPDYNRSTIEKMGYIESEVRLPEDTIRMLHIKMQERIFGDPRKEKFYEEVTSVVDKPTKYNRSSGTMMNFERRQFGIDNTTESHYHPGDRRLHIVTINKEAGVTLNFCGISEIPDDRKDCEVRLDFPKNSMIVLKFPAYTHHKFHGEFVCTSVHPEEGKNILDAVMSGTLQKGFLESATVFSSSRDSQEKMKNLIDGVGKNSQYNRGH